MLSFQIILGIRFRKIFFGDSVEEIFTKAVLGDFRKKYFCTFTKKTPTTQLHAVSIFALRGLQSLEEICEKFW